MTIDRIELEARAARCQNKLPRWRAIRLFNSLPKTICDIKNCSVCSFKLRLDHYLSSIPDLPCSPGYNNSLDGGDYLQRWTPRDDLVAG